jgi:chorismate mutase
MRRVYLILAGVVLLGAVMGRAQTASLQPLVETSAKRLEIAEKVALAKWDSGTAVEDPSREAQVIQGAVKDGQVSGLDAQQVERFYRAQIEANKIIQYSLLAEWQRAGAAPKHAPVDLVKEIRPKLDEVQKDLIAELAATATLRSGSTCHADVARAVGEYLRAHSIAQESRDGVALDRALASACVK